MANSKQWSTNSSITVNNALASTNNITVSGTIHKPLTAKEETRFTELKLQQRVWLKTEKINKFKELPPNIRQEVVDEACLIKCISDIYNVDESGFENHLELEKLEEIRNNNNWLGVSGNGYHDTNSQYKYFQITNMFTREELIDAHSAATIEEAL